MKPGLALTLICAAPPLVQVLPPGVPVANTRPLPVPVELFQLSSLGDILNLDAWQNELDDADREALRALLPNKVGKNYHQLPTLCAIAAQCGAVSC
jgi:hypothetical protein